MAQWKRTHLPMQETQETWVWSLDEEDLLEEEMTTHSSVLAWEIPWVGNLVAYIVHRVTESRK